MQFTSLEFLLMFVPAVLAVYYAIRALGHSFSLGWLLVASLLFYLCWQPEYLPLLLISIGINYQIGKSLAQAREQGTLHPCGKTLLIGGILTNLLLLGYYKYSYFFLKNLHLWFGGNIHPVHLLLPLGISFYTFTQIAFLVDAYQGRVEKLTPLSYALFVSYFPHLMAGPILHHKEMMQQFIQPRISRLKGDNLSVGLSIFSVGLFKKVILADSVACYADPVFAAVHAGTSVGMIEAWGGALAYTFQLYFDFSGYSDMAIGLSRLLGIQLPLNFNSPYKSTSIIEFWRRWHMTLSRFLLDYVYIPLGGNRRGSRYVNLMATMLIGGIWHGAEWTFLIWGGFHGLLLTLNHTWNQYTVRFAWLQRPSRLIRVFAWVMTFGCVVIGWVIFRSYNLPTLQLYLKCLVDFHSIGLPAGWLEKYPQVASLLQASPIPLKTGVGKIWHELPEILWVLPVFLGLALLLPNTQEFFARYRPALGFKPVEQPRNRFLWQWEPRPRWAIFCGVLFLASFLKIITSIQALPFLYFQF